MSEQPPSDSVGLEELERLAKRRKQERKSAQQQALQRVVPEEGLAWLALVPVWSIPLAAGASFPNYGDPIGQVFGRLSELGVLEAIISPVLEDEPAQPTLYSMPDLRRAEVLKGYQESPGQSLSPAEVLRTPLSQIMARVGQGLLKASQEKIGLQPALVRWARLAAVADEGEHIASRFDAEIDHSFSERDAAALLSWIETARPMAALLEAELRTGLSVAIQRAGRLLELLYRQDHDRQHLRAFLPRPAQDAAFAELLDGPDELWALHYIGAGGNGKTMLMRHLSLELLPSDAVSARIDFDYLNPDYPSLAPGLLLWSFAQDLRLQDTTGRVGRYFERADSLFRELHQRLRTTRQQHKGSALDDPRFREALQLYINGFQALDRRVVLIVDTCEELAKVTLDGTLPENVIATFRILRALHDGITTLDDEAATPDSPLASLRVVFSGRRLLAREGHGWYTEPASPLPSRPYLRLHEIRGFDRQEASDYLSAIARGRQGLLLPERAGALSEGERAALLTVPEELRPAIVRSTLKQEPGVPTLRRPDLSGEPELRCNPYELRLYAEWATERPAPTPQEIAQTQRDHYVELRIIRRLESPALLALLPIVAALGHMDRRTLRAISDADDESFDALFAQLQFQEWIDQRIETTGEGQQTRLVLSVQPGMRVRLNAYFQQRERADPEAWARGARHLENVTLQDDLASLSWTDVDAALRALEIVDPHRAAAWWQQLEARLLRERDFKTILNLTTALSGPDGAAGPREPDAPAHAPAESRLRAAVLATHAAALLHTHDFARLPETWREVERKAEAHSLPEQIPLLRLRALAGMIVATHYTGQPPDDATLRGFAQELLSFIQAKDLDLQTSAACLAALDALSEDSFSQRGSGTTQRLSADSSLSDALLNPLFALSMALADRLYILRATGAELAGLDQLAAFACLVAARRHAATGRYAKAAEWFERAGVTLRRGAEADAENRTVELLGGGRTLMDEDPSRLELLRSNLASRPDEAAARPTTAWAWWLAPPEPWVVIALELGQTLHTGLLSPRETLATLVDYLVDQAPGAVLLTGAPVLILRSAVGQVKTLELITWERERLAGLLITLMLANGSGSIPRFTFLGESRESAPWDLIAPGILQTRWPISDPLAEYSPAARALPPYQLVLAEARLPYEMADQTLATLTSPHASDSTIQAHVERTIRRITRRMRQRDEGFSAIALPNGARSLEELEESWALDGLDGPKRWAPLSDPDKDRPLGYNRYDWIHARWRTFYVPRPLSEADIKRYQAWSSGALTWVEEWPIKHEQRGADRAGLVVDSLELDGHEINLLIHPQAEQAPPLSHERVATDDSWQKDESRPEEQLRIWLRTMALDKIQQWEEQLQPAIISRLGLRRAAEIALDEGELLALRLPIRAAPILAQARRWYQQSGDPANSLLAGIAEAIVYGRAGEQEPLAQTLDEIRGAYEQMISLGQDRETPFFKTWSTLEALAAAEQPTRQDLEQLTQASWRPWLVRLVLCMARLRQLEAAEQPNAPPPAAALPLAGPIRELYGYREASQSQEGVLLPAELSGWFEEQGQDAPVVEGSRWKTVLQAVALVTIFLVGAFLLFRLLAGLVTDISFLTLRDQLLIFAGLITGLTAATSLGNPLKQLSASRGAQLVLIGVTAFLLAAPFVLFGTPLESPESQLTPGQTFNAASLIVAMTLLFPLVMLGLRSTDIVERWRAWWDSLSTLSIAMTRRAQGEPDPRQAHIDLITQIVEVRFSLAERIFFRRDTTTFEYQAGTIMLLAPYQEQAEQLRLLALEAANFLAPSMQNLRLKLQQRLTSNLEVQIVPGQDLHGPCWEALIVQTALGEGLVNDGIGFRFRRKAAGKQPRSPLGFDSIQIRSLAVDTINQEIARRGWAGLNQAPFEHRLDVESPLRPRSPAAAVSAGIPHLLGDTRILHLLGVTSDVAGKLEFNLAAGLAPQAPTENVQSERIQMEAPGAIAIGRNLGLAALTAYDVAAAFPNLEICVLQGAPDDNAGLRLEGDRRDAGLMRSFAAELFAQGVAVVIVIPALEPDLAVLVLEAIATAIKARQKVGIKALQQAIVEAQRAIVDRTLAEVELAEQVVGFGNASVSARQEARWEQAFDLCLYAVDDWDGRLA